MLQWPWSCSPEQRHCCPCAACAGVCGAQAPRWESKPQAVGVGHLSVGTLTLSSTCIWWLVPAEGARLLEESGVYPLISIFQTEWRGTPQTQCWEGWRGGAGEGRGRKQGRCRGLSKERWTRWSEGCWTSDETSHTQPAPEGQGEGCLGWWVVSLLPAKVLLGGSRPLDTT